MPLAPIALASRGLTGQRDLTKTHSGDLVTAQNVNYGQRNLLEKEGGSAKVTSASLGTAILAGTDWWPTDLIQRSIIATADGRLLKDSLATPSARTYATVLKAGLTPAGKTLFVEGGAEDAGRARKLFALNGVDPVQVLSGDGVATANLATPPADWAGTNQPTFMFPFRGVRIGGGNANFREQLYASLAADHEDFTAAGTWTLSVYPGGGTLVAGLTAFGRAYLFKYPRGIYMLNDSASAVSGWYCQEISTQFGAPPTPHAVTQVDESVVAFVSASGNLVMMQESSAVLTGVAFTDLVKVLNLRQLMRDNFNLARLDRVQVRWYDDVKQLHVIYAESGAVTENRRLVVDFNEERTRAAITTKDINESMWFERDTSNIARPRTGDASGDVWALDQDPRDVDGTPYTLTVETVSTDFTDIDPRLSVLKLFRYLHLEYEPTGDYNLSAEIFIDGRAKGTVTFNMSAAGATLPFTLPATLGAPSGVYRKTRAIVGEGYYFGLRLTESTANNPRLGRAFVEFDLAGSRR